MFSGMKQNRRKNWASWLLTVMLASASTFAYSGSKSGRSLEASSAKLAAPNLEDNANYFSDNRKDISPEDLNKADVLRRKTIASIEDLLKSKKKSIRRFELLLRLGELYVERHDFLRDGEMASYELAWDGWNKDKKGAEPKLNTVNSDLEMTHAANSFRDLVNEFPKHPRTDAALYSLARVLARMGKPTAADYYKQLIQSFPKSPLIPDAYLSLGEFYFDKHDITASIENYKKVMDFKDHRAYPYAVYKLGWAYYNAPARNENDTKEAYKKAVAAFKLVVKLEDKDREKGRPKNNLDLREEAIKDLIMVWAEGEDVASAWKYFQSIGEAQSFYKMLERLGNIYADQGKNAQAILVFQRLLKDAPKRSNNPEVHAKLLELYDLTNNIEAVVAELKRMHQLYLGQTVWTQANGQNEAALAEGSRVCELNTHRYGALLHQRGQKSKNDAYLKFAAEVYTLYLGSFAGNSNAYDIRYYLAEILYDFKQFEPAAMHYMTVAKAGPQGKYMKPAALNAVAAMNQVVQATKWPALPPPGQVPAPLAIPRVKEKFSETLDQYVALLPKEKDGEPMRFTAAQIAFDYGHYPDAIARFDKITKEIPQTKQAKAAVRVVLGYFADKEDWNNVISWSQNFAKQKGLLDEALQKYVVEVQRASTFKRALAYEKSQNYERAAVSFLEYQKQFPTDGSADRAVYNAMLNDYKIGHVEDAITAGKLALEKYPQSPLTVEVLASVGSTYEALAKFDDAAAMYHRLAEGFPKDKRAPGALFNAAILYKGLGNIDQAIALLGEFDHRYGDNAIGADAAMEYANLLEAKGRNPQALAAYNAYAKHYQQDPEQVLFARAKAASLMLTSGDRTQGAHEIEKLAHELGAKNAPAAFEARRTVAGTLFKQAESAFTEFAAVQLSDGAKIEKQVAAKQAKLVHLAASYEQVMELGSGEYTVASLYRLGEAHENFANVLFKAPAPTGASQADVDNLKTELEKVAFPLKEEAYKFFETAYKRSREVETFTTWTRRTYQKMVELAPQKHPNVNEMSADPTYLSHELKLSKPVAEVVGTSTDE